MSSSSASRGQAEPTVALVAVVAVCLSVSLYAGILDGVRPASERDVASPTLHRLVTAASEDGVVVPAALASAHRVGPRGYALNVTLATRGGRHWELGPSPPRETDGVRAAHRLVSVRTGPGRVTPGTLRVEVWR